MVEFLPRPSFCAADSFEGAREGTEGCQSLRCFGVIRTIFLGVWICMDGVKKFLREFSFLQLPIHTELGTRMGLIYLDMDCINLRFRDRLLLWYWQ